MSQKVELNASALATQLENAHTKIADLEAELRSARALDDHLHRDRTTDDPALLTRVAAALLLANEAEKAIQANAIDTQGRVMRTQTSGFRSPGAGTYLARKHVKTLRKQMVEVVERFELAAEHGWQPPRSEKVPTVRCRIRGCPAEGVTVPAWRRVRGGKRIDAERCQSCGTPYPDNASTADSA